MSLSPVTSNTYDSLQDLWEKWATTFPFAREEDAQAALVADKILDVCTYCYPPDKQAARYVARAWKISSKEQLFLLTERNRARALINQEVRSSYPRLISFLPNGEVRIMDGQSDKKLELTAER